MKELILQALITKFPGIAASILSRIADKLSKTVTTAEQVATAVEGVTVQQVIDNYTESRVTEASASAVANYEKKHNLKDGKLVEETKPVVTPTTNVTPKLGGTDETPSWAKALIEQNKTLSDRLAKMETDRTTTSRKQQLTGITSKLPDAMKKAYERLPVDKYSDEEFSTLMAEVSTEVEGIMKDTTSRGAVVGKPSFVGGLRKEDELTEEQKKLITHREGANLKDGDQPF